MASSTDVIVRRNPKPESYIDGKKQAWIFTNEIEAEEWVLNQSVITDLIPSSIVRGAKDVNGNGYAWFYTSNKVLQLLPVLQNTITQTPIMSIDVTTKEVTFSKNLKITDASGSSFYASLDYVNSKITELQNAALGQTALEGVLTAAKAFTQSNTTYDYNSVADSTGIFIHHKIGKGNLLDLMVSGVMNQQGYVRTARFKVDVSTKEWSFVIDSVDQAPNRSTTILSGNKDYISLSLKQLKALAPGTDGQDAVIKLQLDTAVTETKAYTDTKSTEALTQAKAYTDSKGIAPVNNITQIDYRNSNTGLNTAYFKLIKNHVQSIEIDFFDPAVTGDDPAVGDGFHNVIGVDSSRGLYINTRDGSGTKKWLYIPYARGNMQFFNDAFEFNNTSGSSVTQWFALKNNQTWGVSYNYNSSTDYYVNYWLGSTNFLKFGFFAGTDGAFSDLSSKPYLQCPRIIINDSTYVPSMNKHVTTKDYVDPGMIQIGMEITWPKNAALPTGYLQCNGANFSRTTYVTLGNMYATAGRSTVYISGDPQIALPNRTAPDSFSVIIVRAK